MSACMAGKICGVVRRLLWAQKLPLQCLLHTSMFFLARHLVFTYGLAAVLEQLLPEAQSLHEQHHRLSSLALQ